MDESEPHDHPFYGKAIFAAREEEYIKTLLKKYKNEAVNEELKKKIWDELQQEKYLGNLSIPFKVVMRLDGSGTYPPHIEVILDTRL